LLMSGLLCMQEVPPTEPVEEGDEGVWDTVGEPAGSRSPAPTVKELLAQLERQPPAPQGSTEPVTAAVEEVVASGAQESAAPATLQRRRQPQVHRRRRPPRVDWSTLPASSVPRP
jgi:hypothetical protein